jgi:prolyl-tRNA synthetase
MLLSQSFIFTTRNVSENIKSKSYRWMIQSGLIQQEANGIFYFLPLMKKIIDNVEKIIDDYMKTFGCCKLICPILQNADNWKNSGRYDAYGKEMLRIQDRHHKELIYSPTAEEGFFNIVKNTIKSYRHLPKYIYQINWKFRDELSPRNGLLRSREFLMKDGYSFDNNLQDSYETYLKLYNLYVKIFSTIGIEKYCVVASGDSGPIGGQLNHEIILLTPEGDTEVFFTNESFLKQYDSLNQLENNCGTVEINNKKENIIYKHQKGIELGHLFNYGDKYSQQMDVTFINNNGQKEYIYGGCYGIGVTRLIAAIIELLSDENGIVWPESIAPFKYYIIYQDHWIYEARKIYHNLGCDIALLDDRHESMGVKLKDADLLGIPYQIILGKNIEIKTRKNNNIMNFENIKSLIDYLNK